MTLTGTLEKRFLAGVLWVLVDGPLTYELRGDIPADLDGAQVVVEGERAVNQFSMNMVGPIIEVTAVRAAS